ncbi:MAG: serpin family protein [Caldibacillus sp.]
MKKLLFSISALFFLLAGCTSIGYSAYEKEDYKRIAEANNRFAFTIHEQLARLDEGNNLFFSPTSIHMALSMTVNGAQGETEKQMMEVLFADQLSRDDLNRGHASFLALLSEKDDAVTINVANSLWLKENYPFTKEFVDDVSGYYQAKTNEVDFLNPRTKTDINNWVKEATNKKIDKIVEFIDPATVLYLLNAIYFNGDWKNPFNEEFTHENVFFMEGGKEKKHLFMMQEGEFNYFENDLIQAIELPYKDHEASMYIFLPREGKNLTDVYEQLSFETWNSWRSQMKKHEGILYLPKFQLEYEATLNEVLIALGMEDAFSANADFSRMVEGGGLAISEVKHKSYLDVNEEGTEAAAATAVAVVELAAPVERFTMNINRPFFFAIQENTSGMILFMGALHEPILLD